MEMKGPFHQLRRPRQRGLLYIHLYCTVIGCFDICPERSVKSCGQAMLDYFKTNVFKYFVTRLFFLC